MKILLDTDICIALVNRDDRVRAHLERHRPSALRTSAITLAGLRFGTFDDAAAARYGELRTLLERRGP